jgi:hypothetical protein
MFLLMEIFHYIVNTSSRGNNILNGDKGFTHVYIYKIFPAWGLPVDECVETCKLREIEELCWQK